MNLNTGSETTSVGLLERALGFLCAIPVAIIVVVTFIDVFARYLFSAPVKGSMEIIEYSMALVIFIALPLVTRSRQHVSVSLIDGWVKGGVRRLKMVLCDGLSMGALLLLSWRLWVQATEDLDAGNRTEVLNLPFAPLNFSLAALAAVSALFALGLMWCSAQGKEGSE